MDLMPRTMCRRPPVTFVRGASSSNLVPILEPSAFIFCREKFRKSAPVWLRPSIHPFPHKQSSHIPSKTAPYRRH